jgi:hypothetical protein
MLAAIISTIMGEDVVKPLYFVLSKHSDQQVLACREKQRWMLPRYEQAVATNVGFENPAPFNAWFHNRYGLSVFRRYAIDTEASEVVVFVLELEHDHHTLPPSCAWISPKELAEEYTSYPTLYMALQSLFDHEEYTTMPYARPGGYKQAINWMARRLEESGLALAGSVEQIKNAYVSTVFRAATKAGFVYMKALPPLFVREIEITQQVAAWKLARLPNWIAVSAAQRLVLMRDMGGHDLCEQDGLEMWHAVIRQIAQLQIASVPLVSSPPFDPFYDRRFPALREGIDRLVEEAQRLLHGSAYQLTPQEVAQLHGRRPQWQESCAEIEAYHLPYTVNHDDLRPGNIRIVSSDIIFYDWAWSSIAHPFLSMAMFLHITRRHFADVAGVRECFREAYLHEWQEYAPIDRLRAVFTAIDRIKWLYAAMGDAHWLRVIQEARDWHVPHRVSADAWTLDRRQYYLARVVRRLLKGL